MTRLVGEPPLAGASQRLSSHWLGGGSRAAATWWPLSCVATTSVGVAFRPIPVKPVCSTPDWLHACVSSPQGRQRPTSVSRSQAGPRTSGHEGGGRGARRVPPRRGNRVPTRSGSRPRSRPGEPAEGALAGPAEAPSRSNWPAHSPRPRQQAGPDRRWWGIQGFTLRQQPLEGASWPQGQPSRLRRRADLHSQARRTMTCDSASAVTNYGDTKSLTNAKVNTL